MTSSRGLPTTDRASVCARLVGLVAQAEQAARDLDLDRAASSFEAAYVFATATASPTVAAESIAGLGYVAHLRGDVAAAQDL